MVIQCILLNGIDQYSLKDILLHQCSVHVIRGHAFERVPAAITEDTIDYPAYFAPPSIK
nr:hypothetical protein [uncultured Desulfobacter sp.]